jgi:hypothetical protein
MIDGEALTFERDLLNLGGRGFTGDGLTAGSICQAETLSGRGMEEASSHLTLRERHFESAQPDGSEAPIPTIVPVNFCSAASSPSNLILNLIPIE